MKKGKAEDKMGMRNQAGALLFLAACVPYPFLAMYGDVAHGTMAFYGLLMACTALLVRVKRGLPVLLGSVASGALSCWCVWLFQAENWAGYFKPLAPMQLALVLSGSVAAVHLIAFVYDQRK